MTATTDARRGSRLPIAALVAGNAISLVGELVTSVALPWYVLQTTGSAAKTGIVAFAVTAPRVLGGAFGGAVVDRLGDKRTSIAADLVSGVCVAMVPLLHETLGLAFWQLLILVFGSGLLDVPGMTARRSMLPELAADAKIELERVNAVYEGNHAVASVFGPPLAALLIAWFGPSAGLLFNAATFGVSALVVGLGVPGRLLRARVATGERYIRQLKGGLRFLWEDRLLFWLATMVGLTNGLSAPLFSVMLPVFVDERYGRATELGWIFAVGGIGSILSVILYGSIGRRLPRRVVWIGAFMIVPVGYWVLLGPAPLWLLLAAAAVTGIAGGGLNPLLVTIRHERIPSDLRGRVFSTFSAISWTMTPLGVLAGGLLIEGIGFDPTVIVLGGLSQAAAVAMLFIPSFHEMDRTKGAPAGEGLRMG